MITLAAAVLVFVGDSNPPMPPYKRLSTVTVYANSYEPHSVTTGNRFITASGDSCLAYDLSSMKKLWTFKSPSPARLERVGAEGSTVFVSSDLGRDGKDAPIYALNASTGKVLWKLSKKGGASALVVVGSTLYTGLNPFQLVALDLKSRKPRWQSFLSKQAPNGMEPGEIEAIAVSGNRLVASAGNTTYGIDLANGKVMWKEPESYLFQNSIPVSAGIAWVPSNEGSVARELKTGKVLWRSPTLGFGDYGGVFQGLFVGIDHGKLVAMDPKTGKVRWSHEVGPNGTSGGYQYGAVFSNRLFVQGISKSMIVGPKGEAIWSGSTDQSVPAPVWTDGKHLVCFDTRRLIRYAHGAEIEMPKDSAGRQAVAKSMVGKYDQLDPADIKKLTDLGDDAFEPLLAEFIKTCRAHDAMGEKGDSFPLYSKYHDIAGILMTITKPNREKELIGALAAEKKGAAARPTLLTLLARLGSPENFTPYFLKEIEGVETPGFEMYESTTYVARQYVVNSSDPRAVAFMMKQLEDPKADSVLRYEAYVNLARTGGEEGLKAVLADRQKRTLLRPLAERVTAGFLNAGEFGSRQRVIGEKKDAEGRTWGLLESGVLGSRGDLWLAEKVDGQWVRPYFTGVSTSGVSRWAKPAPPEPTIAGKKAADLVSGGWFDVLAKNEEIRRDTDGDGLTDLVEKRLSTDPNNKDMDGDGDPDSVDPWPNAPRRELSDEEKVLDAAFEARYHGGGGEGAGIFFAPPGMKPFEMVGRQGPVIWAEAKATRDWSRPLEQCYEQGVAFINFHSADRRAAEASAVGWNPDKTEATLVVSTYYGGLNGTGYQAIVRKFGDQWVVVSMRMAYVS